MKSSQRRRPLPTSFARIAPQPARLPSLTEQQNKPQSPPSTAPPSSRLPSSQHPRHHSSQSGRHSHHQQDALTPHGNTSSRRPGPTSTTSPPVPFSSPFDYSASTFTAGHTPMGSPVCTMYPYVSMQAIEAPIPQTTVYPFPGGGGDGSLSYHGAMSNDTNDNGSSAAYDPTLGWFADLDDLPEDWSTFFWSH